MNQFTNFDNDLQISNAIYVMTGDNYENDMLIIRQSKMNKEESDNDNDLELKSENVHVTTASAYDYERVFSWYIGPGTGEPRRGL